MRHAAAARARDGAAISGAQRVGDVEAARAPARRWRRRRAHVVGDQQLIARPRRRPRQVGEVPLVLGVVVRRPQPGVAERRRRRGVRLRRGREGGGDRIIVPVAHRHRRPASCRPHGSGQPAAGHPRHGGAVEVGELDSDELPGAVEVCTRTGGVGSVSVASPPPPPRRGTARRRTPARCGPGTRAGRGVHPAAALVASASMPMLATNSLATAPGSTRVTRTPGWRRAGRGSPCTPRRRTSPRSTPR